MERRREGPPVTADGLDAHLEERRMLVDAALERSLPAAADHPRAIHEAIRYTVFAGGKRLRPILVLAATEAAGGRIEDALPAAVAIELIHTYSLVHDDLPAMDDDDFRRGRPTCHKVYGDAIAILVGDALQTQAFMLLSDPVQSPRVEAGARLRVIHEVAVAAGSRGMVGGQVVDILQEDREVDLPTLEYLHTHKTGALFRACLRVGGIIAGAEPREMEALSRYGERIGLAFQIVDDLLDLKGTLAALGKTAGSDLRKKKATFPALLGIEESRRRAERLIDEARRGLAAFGERAGTLAALADFVVTRQR
jgi:geranylgeranyl diphosphate synthase type II